ncbi:MAG: hypothetical protein JWM43_751 [Acidobacteriaceae bacterium]|nr:hypothetical protein [Acidobacteriaceae bacterium]
MTRNSGMTRRDLLKLPASAAALRATASLGFAQTVPQYAPLRDTPYPDSSDLEGPAFERVTFEMSPKPFRVMTEQGIRDVCVELFRQWAPLIRRVNGVAIMLWTADGSEILDYRGRMADEIEWARYIGIGSPPKDAPGDDPGRIGLHAKSHLYMENPPRMTYAALALIVKTLKSVGREMTGKPITVGATFDPGPEFANSKFKYVRHPEIAKGDTHGRDTWVSCIARLNADDVAYAGFPKGIAQDTSIGTFLGGQSEHFLKDLGYDYLWLSNGFGFSISAWDVKGPLFDGTRFDVGQASILRDKILGFWKDFRKQCPAFPLETRGTNLLLGSDLATSACPLQSIYDGGFNMTAPPNSPWAALDGDFGLELVGYLSRIAELPPGDKFPFRFYIHDPWWLNSPWFDRYGREPHDIYLPLALARINGNAGVTRPAYLEFLTVDNSYGRMPEQGPNEVTPHVLSAMDSYSDAPGLMTWICPFHEYHEMVFGSKPQPELAFFADWFLRGAVNAGLPLNTVVSTGNFLSSLQKNPDYFDDTILVSIVPPGGTAWEQKLMERVQRKLPVLFYGPVSHASEAMLELLNLKATTSIEGELTLASDLDLDHVLHGKQSMLIEHRSILCAGGVSTITRDAAKTGSQVLATVRSGAIQRVYAVQSGSAAWIRGTFSSSIPSTGSRIPIPDNPANYLLSEVLTRGVAARLGYSIRVEKPQAATRLPVIFGARCRNGYFLSGYSASTTVTLRLRLPWGAPVLVGVETWLEDGHSTYMMPRSWHREVRCFVDQKEGSEVSCVEHLAGMVGFQRRLLMKGLKDATVTFFPEGKERVILAANDMRLHNEQSIPYTRSADGSRITASGITGTLFISW